MDSVELARQSAAMLHANLVAAGGNPWSPYTFVVAEAKRRNIDVESAAPGAAVLHGARATFVAADDLIIHEKAGTPFEQALLVAHEIGHVELGDDPDGVAPTIDFARVAEPSPVGADRVIDYGRRQRREIQMDLFAREFLFPRDLARTLHIDEGLSASDIAARLGAPFEVVAQQLFDALLLPKVPSPTAEVRPEYPLNERQAEAAEHRGEAYLLEAGPGTGKTQTLAARVESLLQEGVDPRRILLLTFSNKAAGEMSDRIAQKRPDAAAAMWIGTFHAFGLDIIRRFHTELGFLRDPRMLDRTEAVELLEEEFPRLRLVHYRNLYDPTQIIVDILAAVSRAKDEVVDAKKYEALANSMLTATGSDIEAQSAAECAHEVARVYQIYEDLKRKANSVDFGDLVALPVELLEGNDAVRALLQAQYDHVLVDEYQDVNRSSVRLLSALRPDGRNLWMVGDVKQSIYRFRGASSFNMARFGGDDFPGGKRGRLKRNYRSVEEIVKSYSRFATDMKVGDADSGLDANRANSGKPIELRRVRRAEHQSVALAEAIDELRSEGITYRDQAILCTGNEKLSEIGRDLERLGIPVLFLGSLFERPEVKDLLALLSILVDRRAMGLVRVACLPEFKCVFADVATILDELRSTEYAPMQWLSEPLSVSSLSEDGRRAIGALETALSGFDQEAAPWKVIATVLLDRTRMAARLGASDVVADRTRGIAIWQLLNFLRSQPIGEGLPIARVLDRIRRLVRIGDDRDLRQLPSAAQHLDAVRLMTIHGAKGLEFSGVHIPGVNKDTIPRNPNPPTCLPPEGMIEGAKGSAVEVFRLGQEEEQECLFFVAISRARDRLIFYAPKERVDGASRPTSPFLDRLGDSLIRRDVEPGRALPIAEEAQGINLKVNGRLSFEVSQIGLYESCPRRFFYTHVLKVGGRRTATAFMNLHEAVRSVVKTIIAVGSGMSADDIEKHTDVALAMHGLAGHGYYSEYRDIALAMLSYFSTNRALGVIEAATALRIDIDGEELVFYPDEILVRPDGGRTVRRIRTGHGSDTENKDIGAAALVLAVTTAFPGATAEVVHLSDEEAHQLSMSSKVLSSRKDKLRIFLQGIRSGQFSAKSSPRTCPNCPAFFICGSTPSGALEKKFV